MWSLRWSGKNFSLYRAHDHSQSAIVELDLLTPEPKIDKVPHFITNSLHIKIESDRVKTVVYIMPIAKHDRQLRYPLRMDGRTHPLTYPITLTATLYPL